MNLERYRVPSNVWEGEWIELPDSDGARFLVKLPAAANREWQREVLDLMIKFGMSVDDTGKVDADALSPAELADFRQQRRESFARLCVIRGPDGFDLAQLTGEYWPALVALYGIAVERADRQDEEAEASVGESSALPAGIKSGQTESSSTSTS